MSRRIGCLLLIAIFCMGSGSVLMAAGKGNARKGKYLFRKHCRTCHLESGSAKESSPISKTQAEWQKAFDEYNQFPCKAAWNELSEKDRIDIFAHLHGHAFDSPSPAKCK